MCSSTATNYAEWNKTVSKGYIMCGFTYILGNIKLVVKNRSAVSQQLAVGRRCDCKWYQVTVWGSEIVQYPNDCGGS